MKKRFVDLDHLVPQKAYPPLKLETYEVDLLISILKAQSPAMDAYHRHINGEGTPEDEVMFQGSAEYRLWYHLSKNGNCLTRDTFLLTAHMHLLLCKTENGPFYQRHRRELFALGAKMHTWWLMHSTNLLEPEPNFGQAEAFEHHAEDEIDPRYNQSMPLEHDDDGFPYEDYDEMGWTRD